MEIQNDDDNNKKFKFHIIRNMARKLEKSDPSNIKYFKFVRYTKMLKRTSQENSHELMPVPRPRTD